MLSLRQIGVNFLIVLLTISLPTTAMAELPALDKIYEKLGVNPAGAVAVDLEKVYKKYVKRKKHKALAFAMTTDNYSVGYSYKAPSELNASQVAMAKCEEWRTDHNFGGRCEILLLGDVFVLPGAVAKSEINDATPAMAWRVEGSAAPLYLIGTIHLLKPSLLPLPAAFDRAFAQSDRVAFEINPILATDPERVQALQAVLKVDAKEQKSLYDKETRKLVRAYAKNSGIPAKAVYTAPAVINALQIFQLKMSALGYSFNTGVEMHYARQASKTGKGIIELEGPTDALVPLINLPMEKQLLMLRDAIEHVDASSDQLDILINSWLFGDAEQLYAESYKSLARYPELNVVATEMLDNRNQRWMVRIAEMLKEPRSMVVMVGAGHFGGERGLLALLREHGMNPVQQTWAGKDITQEPSAHN